MQTLLSIVDNPIIVGLSLLALVMMALAAFQTADGEDEEARRTIGIGVASAAIVLALIVIAGTIRFLHWLI